MSLQYSFFLFCDICISLGLVTRFSCLSGDKNKHGIWACYLFTIDRVEIATPRKCNNKSNTKSNKITPSTPTKPETPNSSRRDSEHNNNDNISADTQQHVNNKSCTSSSWYRTRPTALFSATAK